MIAAADFFTAEVWTARGLVTYHVLFVVHHVTRAVHIAGIEVVHTAFQAPNMNAHAERWVSSVKSECLDRMILFGATSLRRALREYGAHFHQERPHQGLGNELIAPEQSNSPSTGNVVETKRLGGLLRSYQRLAA